MSAIRRSAERDASGAAQLDPPPVYLEARAEFAARYLSGEGLEIGPLHQPLAMPPQARARYVDRMKSEELRREYPELAGWDLTEVDVVDDGETLATVADGSQDFIVANHFLEHCENPIGTIETHLSKLKPGGILFYAVPDKRYTFDFRRSVTPLAEMVADYEEGPERSRRQHYLEWSRLVDSGEEPERGPDGNPDEAWVAKRAGELEAAAYSIHMHVWTQAEFLQLILACRERLGDAFELEAAARKAIEFVVVLRKQGPPPAPAPPPAGAAAAAPSLIGKLEHRARLTLGRARAELRRRRERP